VLYHALGKRVISPVPLGENGKASNVVPLRRPATPRVTRSGQVRRRNGVLKRRAEGKRPLKR
jgi:hypothetical protein